MKNGKLWMWIAGGLLAVLAAGGGKVIDHGERLAVVETCIMDIRDDVREIKAWVDSQPLG